MSKNRKPPVNPTLLARARAMRHDPAPAEQKLWHFLRNRNLGGYKFRRQVPLGSFIADFCCHEANLIVELDGASHLDGTGEDGIRTELLNRAGHRVIRFWNTDVFENLEGVLNAIYGECERVGVGTHPHPNPLPEGEGVPHPHPSPFPEGKGVEVDVAGAVNILRRGGVVAFPTETVYGLGADATNAGAVARVFAIKGRPPTNPLICHVADEATARRYAREWPVAATKLVARFWPGPLTLVLPKTDAIVPAVSAGLDTVGLRVPDHPLAIELLRAFDGPLAGPSANRSTHVSPTTAKHVYDELGATVDMILDGGACAVGIESTVLDLAHGQARILRPGEITREMIEQVLGVEVRHEDMHAEAYTPMRSPGQHLVHYSPRTPSFRFDSKDRDRLDLNDAAIIELTLDPQTYARNFYARLRLLDVQQLRAIYIEMPPDTLEWEAIRDRISRATRPLQDEN